jgi:hypothetical protein
MITAAAPAHVPAFLKALTPHEILWGAVAVLGLLVLGRMARAVGHLAKAAAKTAAAPVAAASGGSGGGLKLKPLLLAGGLIGGVVLFLRSGIRPSAGHSHAAPSPSPSPVPTVTRTVAPHITNVHFPLTGGDVVAMWVIAGIVAIVIVTAVLRRGD